MVTAKEVADKVDAEVKRGCRFHEACECVALMFDIRKGDVQLVAATLNSKDYWKFWGPRLRRVKYHDHPTSFLH